MCKMVSVTSITIVEVALVIMGDFNDAGGESGCVKMVFVTSITIVQVALVIKGDFNDAAGESGGLKWCL